MALTLEKLKPKIRKDERVDRQVLEVLAESNKLPQTYMKGNQYGDSEFALGPRGKTVMVYNGCHPEEDYF